MENSTELEKHIDSLRNYVARTDHKYAINYQKGRDIHPIPFFGNIKTAEILTVGANPSNAEFLGNREWPKEINAIDLMNRLINYFNCSISPHPWFEKWEKALRHLNRSYSDGTAAHIDLTPRATFPIRHLKDKDIFIEMVEKDIEWFFKLIILCSLVKLILIAGSITNKYYINEFIEKHSGKNDFKWLIESKRGHGPAFTSSHKLKFKDKTYPIFYCSSGPSDTKKPGLFIERIDEKKDRLLNHLE